MEDAQQANLSQHSCITSRLISIQQTAQDAAERTNRNQAGMITCLNAMQQGLEQQRQVLLSIDPASVAYLADSHRGFGDGFNSLGESLGLATSRHPMTTSRGNVRLRTGSYSSRQKRRRNRPEQDEMLVQLLTKLSAPAPQTYMQATQSTSTDSYKAILSPSVHFLHMFAQSIWDVVVIFIPPRRIGKVSSNDLSTGAKNVTLG